VIPFAAWAAASVVSGSLLLAQGSSPRPAPNQSAALPAWRVDPAMLLNPSTDTWPTFHGDYTGQRHSKLAQITPGNVHQLTLAWTFQTGQAGGIKSTPILVNGIMYITAPDNIWAMDARNGRQLWRYTYPNNQGFHIGHRGAAVYEDTVYLTTPDAHLIALNALTGQVRWDVIVADFDSDGYQDLAATSSWVPLAVRRGQPDVRRTRLTGHLVGERGDHATAP